MASDNGWPDPARPGVPLHPEREAPHWIVGWGNALFVAEWTADPDYDEWGGYWQWPDGDENAPGMVAQGWTYAGPCLTPNDHAAALAQARREGAAAMREVFTGNEAVNAFLSGFYGSRGGFTESIRAGLENIRALPLPGGEDGA